MTGGVNLVTSTFGGAGGGGGGLGVPFFFFGGAGGGGGASFVITGGGVLTSLPAFVWALQNWIIPSAQRSIIDFVIAIVLPSERPEEGISIKNGGNF